MEVIDWPLRIPTNDELAPNAKGWNTMNLTVKKHES